MIGMLSTEYIVQVDAAIEEVEELSDLPNDVSTDLSDAEDSGFAVCDLITDISPDLYMWAIIVTQVTKGDNTVALLLI